MRSTASRTGLVLLGTACVLLLGCGYGGGAEFCFWDAYGSYACGGSYGDPYYDDPYYPYDPWYKADGIDPCVWLRWAGNANDMLVLDATDDVVRFASEVPHVLLVDGARAPDLEVTADGELWCAGRVVGRIALLTAPSGVGVATLVDAAGRPMDLRLEDDVLVLATTDVATLPADPTAAVGTACDAAPEPRHRLALLDAPDDASAWERLPDGDVALVVR